MDSFRHKGLRNRLVKEISNKGIQDGKVLSAIGAVPRHMFFESSFIQFAYQDKAFPIGAGQTISQPYTVAFQSELLEVLPGQKVLEVGTGSGYQAAVLCELGAKVYTIERQRELYVKCSKLLPKMGYKLRFFLGDGYKGLPQFGLFDRIIVTAGAPQIPEDLLTQLSLGGMMVIPLGGGEVQVMTRITRESETAFSQEEFGHFAFVPMLKGIVK
ncbi:protein-L-isoaspartate(D-aspartate) O-methyltransferase [Saccharicrinis fermentans]|uniref:Protein-L-isoaspartate O-methyltransferase n=1 Tax=Saccharicrinis fermentans DSM 9555 = JCM 21142 TaxID=869213 RepID=W7YDH4_9BACT|nr:protein-L-isoaspartate(D-aspartate) O-methyltransferase [Saccharicrinis fermentans]GAF02536.1 L-isoaspartate O-methyltransferase [Saccharicrinis fermentans DSM 9555 = JCM 21142]